MSDHSRAPEAQAGYYARHIFFCLNERPNGEDCCALHGAKEGFDHCKRGSRKPVWPAKARCA
jgi:hypothetical protein